MDHDRLRGEISSKTIGAQAFIRYTIAMILIHHTMVFVLSAWSFAHFGLILLQILVSSVVSSVLIFLYDMIRK